jgi:hypothetical protein
MMAAYRARAKMRSSSAMRSTMRMMGSATARPLWLRQFGQDALDFGVFAHLQAAVLVVELDRGDGLHPQRGAAAALVVHDALDAAFGVGA